MTLTTRLTRRAAALLDDRTSRRGFLGRTAVVGSALAVAGPTYVLRPGTAYAAVTRLGCSDCGGEGPCCDGYTEFCCHLSEDGANECPPGTVLAGWWKVDNSDFCFGTARYYMDCNKEAPACSCGRSGTCQDDPAACGCSGCDARKDGCTVFRYGNCHNEVACVGPIMCRVVTCAKPWEVDPTCSEVPRTDELTRHHHRPCLERDPTEAELAFVRALYVDFLGRRPEPSEEPYWGTQLVRGSHLDRSIHDVIAVSFGFSKEYVRVVVVGIYDQALGRHPSDEERDFWVDLLLDRTLTPQEMAVSVYGGEEFFLRSRQDLPRFVARCYRRILGRDPTEDEHAYWLGQLEVGQTREDVARQIFASVESRRRRVIALYERFLNRRPEDAGRDFWVDVLAEGEDLSLAVFLAGSEEYDLRAGDRFARDDDTTDTQTSTEVVPVPT